MVQNERSTPFEPATTSRQVSVTVNGKQISANVRVRSTLAEFLREDLGLTGTKVGCNRAECGTCTVLVDGKPIFSCTMLAVEADGKYVETIEGLSSGVDLHPIQRAFVRNDALQCGFCVPGIIMSIKALLDENKKPTCEEVKHSIEGNYCRCGAYPNMIKAAVQAAEEMSA